MLLVKKFDMYLTVKLEFEYLMLETDLQSKISVYKKWKALKLSTNETLFPRRSKTHDANWIFPAIFVEQLAIPFVHLQVLI